MRNLVRFLLAFMLCAPFPARAQSVPESSPLPGSRTLKIFDFEETRLGNFESTPMYWIQVGGKGYPAYSTGAFDRKVYHSANTSFQLHTEGGSVAYRFPRPDTPVERRIPIQPNADYYILAFVRTAQLEHARADLVAWFADEQGNLLFNTEAHSQPYHPQSAPEGAWQVLYIYMPGPVDPPDAPVKPRTLALQVGLLQPQQFGATDSKLGKFSIYQQDIQGSVWFDDIAVFQLPRVGITIPKSPKSTAPAGVFSADEPVELDLLVSDLTRSGTPETSSKLHTRLRITDSDNLLFASEEWQASTAADKSWSHRFSHAPLPAGLYTATLEIFDSTLPKGPLIARRQAQFLCLPPATGSFQDPTAEFGLGAISWNNAAAWGDLPAYLRFTHAGTIQLPAWRLEMTEEALSRRDPPFDALLATLQRQNIRAIGAFSELPAAISSHLKLPDDASRTDIFSLLSADPKLWRPFMSFVLTRYTNRIDRWELGSPNLPFSGTLPDLSSVRPAAATNSQRAVAFYAGTYPDIATLLPRPQLVIPWNALFEFNAAEYPHAMLDLRLPAVIKPSQIPAYLASFRRTDTPIIAHLEGLAMRSTSDNTPPPDGGSIRTGGSRADRIADFAQRLVYTRLSAPETVLYDITANKPDELLLVYSTMAHALGGSTSAAELPLSPGIRAFLFNKPGGATLVLWNDSASAGELPLDLPLGRSPRTSDLLGNPRTLTMDQTTQLTHVVVTSTPQVIEQIDARPLQLAASFSITTPMLPAGVGSVQTEILLKTSFADSISGMLRLIPPRGWTVDPPSFLVTLAAGGSLRQPVIVRYPFTETAGPKPFGARLNLDPGNPTGLAHLDFSYPVSVGSDLIDMECFTVIQPSGDILIQQVITNTSKVPLNAQSYALVPGFQRQTRYITDLQPGETTVKRFTFVAGEFLGLDGKPASPASLKGLSATLGVRENDGRTLLTKAVPID